jgi:hypothetical protein
MTGDRKTEKGEERSVRKFNEIKWYLKQVQIATDRNSF